MQELTTRAEQADSWYWKWWSAFASLLPVFIVILLYILGSINFVFCEKWVQCPRIEVAMVLPDKTSGHMQDDTSNDSGKSIMKRSLIAQQYSERIIWVFLMMVQVLIILSTLAVAVLLCLRTFCDWKKRSIALGSMIVGTVLAFLAMLHVTTKGYASIVHQLLKETDLFPSILGTVNTVNSLAYAAAAALVITCCVILWPTRTEASRDPLKELSKLSIKAKHMNVVLYMATAVLIASVLWMNSIIRLALASIPRLTESDVEVTESLTSAVVAAEGGFYTLLLAAVFLPAFYILHARAGSLNLSGDKKQREKVLQTHGLKFSFAEILTRTLTVLGPLLAGPIADLFNQVAGG